MLHQLLRIDIRSNERHWLGYGVIIMNKIPPVYNSIVNNIQTFCGNYIQREQLSTI